MFVKINSHSQAKQLDLYVVQTSNEDSCKSPVIFSFKILAEFALAVHFNEIDGCQVPSIYKGQEMIPSYYTSEAQLGICYGYVDELKPREKRHVFFEHFNKLLSLTLLVLSGFYVPKVLIFP